MAFDQYRRDPSVIQMGSGDNEPERRGLLDHGSWVVWFLVEVTRGWWRHQLRGAHIRSSVFKRSPLFLKLLWPPILAVLLHNKACTSAPSNLSTLLQTAACSTSILALYSLCLLPSPPLLCKAYHLLKCYNCVCWLFILESLLFISMLACKFPRDSNLRPVKGRQ